MRMDISPATSPDHLEIVRTLFTEYAQSLGFSLCFQGFDEEIATLPGAYAPPQGRLLLATLAGEPAGCVAIRPLEGDACELKRLFVRPAHRATGLGRALMDRILAEARAAGYRRMRLDTVVGTIDRAIAMYRRYGFEETEPYGKHPVPGTIDMELEL
ncbi:MAG TPA: GNAT family N-acetyltransferase [Gemmatimonadales bacterium]|nr:GNAT family N-acetyltransferase [Gemmatimonadales bacterium]